ncbi:CD8A protein, partial [Cinclus mexicanus]|nr:CD8A protein [Cinclus mexicanus]
MDTSAALLLLLTLEFCEYRHGGVQPLHFSQQRASGGVRSPRDITQLQVGQRLELECQTHKNSGAFWIRQDKRGTLHFIVFINSVSRTTFGNQGTATRFETSKHNTVYNLVVKSFTPQDEGNYFCVVNYNQKLYFSPIQPASL